MRKPFQGVGNIIRFNWHFYALSLGVLLLLALLNFYIAPSWLLFSNTLLLLILASTLISLAVSYFVYDVSDLYRLYWLNRLNTQPQETMVNIHAGFDETSVLLKNKFDKAQLCVLDFYDPAKHTEVSIKRARKAYPPFPHTQRVGTTNLPLTDNSTDTIFAILSAHEIREPEERIAFFRELRRSLKTTGQIVVTEHLRDTANFLAYNIGFFHFHSRKTWISTFQAAKLTVTHEINITPFITTFVLEKPRVTP